MKLSRYFSSHCSLVWWQSWKFFFHSLSFSLYRFGIVNKNTILFHLNRRCLFSLYYCSAWIMCQKVFIRFLFTWRQRRRRRHSRERERLFVIITIYFNNDITLEFYSLNLKFKFNGKMYSVVVEYQFEICIFFWNFYVIILIFINFYENVFFWEEPITWNSRIKMMWWNSI